MEDDLDNLCVECVMLTMAELGEGNSQSDCPVAWQT